MATTVPAVPRPLDPRIARYDAAGKPTIAQIEYEQRMLEFLRALAAAVQGG